MSLASTVNNALNKKLGAKAAVSAGATIVGNLLNSAIGNGYLNTAGSMLSTLGGLAGSIIGLFNPFAGAAVSVGSGLLGGLTSRAFGVKTNLEALNLYNQNMSYLKGLGRATASTFDDIQPLLAMGFRNPYSNGWFGGSAGSKNNALRLNFLSGISFALRGIENNANILNSNLIEDFNRKYTGAAYGGFLPSIDSIDSILDYAKATDDFLAKTSKNNNKNMDNTFTSIPSVLAGGGPIDGILQAHGGTWGTTTHINKGGTHEENPNEGVKVGVDKLGTPNLVEEGEVIFKDYVFSNRLTVPKSRKYAKGGKLKKGDLSYEEKVLKPFAGMTFADAAKKAEKMTGANDRPNDPIALRGLTNMFENGGVTSSDSPMGILGVLMVALEKEREKEKLAELQQAIEQMSPEELAMLQQQMAAGQLLANQQAMAEQQQQMVPQGMELMQYPMEEQQPIAALGGLLNGWNPVNKFDDGGTIYQKLFDALGVKDLSGYMKLLEQYPEVANQLYGKELLSKMKDPHASGYSIDDANWAATVYDLAENYPDIWNNIPEDERLKVLDYTRGKWLEGFTKAGQWTANTYNLNPRTSADLDTFLNTLVDLYERAEAQKSVPGYENSSLKTLNGEDIIKIDDNTLRAIEKAGLLDEVFNPDDSRWKDVLKYYNELTKAPTDNTKEDIKKPEVTTLTEESKVAPQYTENQLKLRKSLERKYRKGTKNFDYDKLTGHGKAEFDADFQKVLENPDLLKEDKDNQLSISRYEETKPNISFSHFATNEARDSYFPILKPNENGKFNINYPLAEGVSMPAASPYIDEMYSWDADKGKWFDVNNKEVENPFGEGTKFSDVSGGGINSLFENQDALSEFYRNKIADRFKALKGEDYLESRLPNYYLSKEELNNWINDLKHEGIDEEAFNNLNTEDKDNVLKERELAKMLTGNWNLDADDLIESESYLGLDAVKNNRLQRDAKPGIEHIPYIEAASPYTAKRYLEIGADNKPTGKWVNYAPNSGFKIINPNSPVNEGGVNTYQVKRTGLNDYVGVRFDAKGNPTGYYQLDPSTIEKIRAQLIQTTDPRYKSLTSFEDPADGYDFTPQYYELNDDAYKALGFDNEGYKTVKGNDDENDPFPKAPNWPYLAAGLALLGALGYNIFSKPDYSNADAMIKASMQAGNYMPISYTPRGNFHVYKPDDPWFYTSPLTNQVNSTVRYFANSNSPSKGANILAATNNYMNALGNVTRLQLEHNDEKQFKDKEANNALGNTWSEGFLKADMANQDAYSRAKGFSLEGQKAGYTMRQAIDDAKSASINAGINGLVNLLPTYAQNKYNQDMVGWSIRQGVYGPLDIEGYKKAKYKYNPQTGEPIVGAKGGKLTRRKKGLNF